MAMGKAVVSTRIGAEGLPVTHGENVILADKAEDFADAVIRLLIDVPARRRLEKASRLFVEQNCSWKKAASVFADICRRVAKADVP
jgi:glycosyltransferase involved in cell wall biosynthesis